MKNWLKKVSEKEIVKLLESQSDRGKLYHLSPALDKNIKTYIYSKKETRMKRTIPKQIKFLLAAAALIIIAVPLYFIFYNNSFESEKQGIKQTGNAVVSFYFGTTEYMENNEWQPLEVGYKITENSAVRTGPDSELEITYPDNSIVMIKEDTELIFTKLSFTEEENHSDIYMVSGALIAKVTKLSGNSSFNLTSNCAVLGVRGTEFLVETDSSYSNIIVKEGTVAVRKNIVLPESVTEIKEKYPEAGNIIAGLNEQEVLVNKQSRIEINTKQLNETQNNVNASVENISKLIEEKEEKGLALDEDDIKEINKSINELKNTEKTVLEQDVIEIPDLDWKMDYEDKYSFEKQNIRSSKETEKREEYNIDFFTDFSNESSMLNFYKNEPLVDIFEIEDGVLHMKSKAYTVSDSLVPTFELKDKLGTRFTFSFNVLFKERINEMHPFIHIYFMQNEDSDSVYCLMFEPEGIGYFVNSKEFNAEDNIVNMPVETERWYFIEVTLKRHELSIYLDNELIDTLEVDQRIENEGSFIIQTHNEILLDDLSVEGDAIRE